jgi:Flp pilus assembly pilin Flp
MLPKLMKGGSVNTSALKAFWQEEDGQDLVEYALLMAFIALAAVAVLTSVQTNVTKLWNSISNALSDAVTSAG